MRLSASERRLLRPSEMLTRTHPMMGTGRCATSSQPALDFHCLYLSELKTRTNSLCRSYAIGPSLLSPSLQRPRTLAETRS